jgi:hypothetical protein
MLEANSKTEKLSKGTESVSKEVKKKKKPNEFLKTKK